MVDHTSEKLKHVAVGGVIAVVALALLGTAIMSGVSTEGLEITESSIKKGAATQAVVLLSVKNIGNSPISDISGSIDGLPSGVFVFDILTGQLDVGRAASFSEALPSSDTLPMGTSYPVTITATSVHGNTVIETGILYVTRI